MIFIILTMTVTPSSLQSIEQAQSNVETNIKGKLCRRTARQ